MNIDIICVGNLKESFWREGADEYIKRLNGYCNLEIIQIKEAALPKNAKKKAEENVISAEGQAILGKIKKQSYVFALDVKGKGFTSEGFAEKVAKLSLEGKSRLVFIIGGSLGLSKEVLETADVRISFSQMTYPHQLMRVILLEQLYRTYKINNGETYHK